MLSSKRSAGRTSATAAVALVGRGARLGLRLDGMQLLQNALDKHAEWGASVQKALSSEITPDRLSGAVTESSAML